MILATSRLVIFKFLYFGDLDEKLISVSLRHHLTSQSQLCGCVSAEIFHAFHSSSQ